ncbi:hypothetical protein LX16_0879 [Stackebrandtia albiflava]|uniref:DUF3558 domain-containing protein n=1 Tax=Stackebrandtia albiflava TaxID=406432 RepID=A0A562VBD2_9ACTN|nr:hypothetical protein [Stackebrandtia albiflava]TWJ15179.1 hypothetical protein LX16_0879 [Stackebrandtia albiflava]
MRGVSWAGLVVAGGTAAAMLLSGCTPPDDQADAAPPDPDGSAVQEESAPVGEAADAGGICAYLDFASLSQATGETFSVAVAGGEGEVTSCVVQTTAGSFPDVTLTKAKTATDADTYRAEIPPEDSQDVDELGKAAYSVVREAVPGGGPVVEIGWLTDGHMYSLRYTTALDTEAEAAEATVAALVEVVRQVDELAAAAEEE